MEPLHLLILLLAGHALCDYPLQGDFLAKAKNPHTAFIEIVLPWWLAMASHAMIHAAAVLVVTNSVICALIEFFAHFIIDLQKCLGWLTLKQDQFAHIMCKLLYVGLVCGSQAT